MTHVRISKILRTPEVDVPPVKCAIPLEKLNEFDRLAMEEMGKDYETATMRDIVSAIIQPMCDTTGKAYARTLNDEKPVACQVFVCHCWDERFSDFVASVNDACKHLEEPPNLWISAFALMQTRRRTPLTRPSDSPFAAALKGAQGILVIQNQQVDITSRLWILWEIFLAQKFGILDKKDGLLLAGPMSKPDRVDGQRAQTSNADEKAVLSAAIEAEGGFHKVVASTFLLGATRAATATPGSRYI